MREPVKCYKKNSENTRVCRQQRMLKWMCKTSQYPEGINNSLRFTRYSSFAFLLTRISCITSVLQFSELQISRKQGKLRIQWEWCGRQGYSAIFFAYFSLWQYSLTRKYPLDFGDWLDMEEKTEKSQLWPFVQGDWGNNQPRFWKWNRRVQWENFRGEL